MTPAALAALGLGQLVNWGVLYYAFAVLLQPVQADLGVPTWVVTGAFSLALLVSAVMAPTVGRWSDRGHAARAMTLGGVGGAALLVTWTLVPGVVALYAVWAALGVCMSAALYEPAFALVTRAHLTPEHRLRALAIVTLFGGLASTVFLPLTAVLVSRAGWRAATGILAVLLMVATVLTASTVPAPPPVEARCTPQRQSAGPAARRHGLGFLTMAFGIASLASASFIANLVPALGDRGVTPRVAAYLGGLFGVMQLPGRALMASRRLDLSGPLLLGISLGLQALGLVLVATLSSTAAVAVGVMTFAAGSGLTTLARPYLVQAEFPIAQSGFVNGRLARAQQLSRALGPIAASSVASLTSQSTMLLVLGAILGVTALLAAAPRRLAADRAS